MGYEGDTCSFTCNTGYELTGSDIRTCQSDGSWSGIDAVCRRGNVWFILCSYYLSALFQFHVHFLLLLAMEQSIVHWEMIEILHIKTLVISHVTLVMS